MNASKNSTLSFHLIIYFLLNWIANAQILDNIINFKKPGLQYISFSSYSNGDLIFETSYNPYNRTRFFYGFKNNGRGYFEDSMENKNTYYREINAANSA